MAMNKSKYEDIISKSVLIQSGPPAVYHLRPKKENIGSLRRMTFGERNVNKINKTILLVGETGTGKSTLINALVNYAMGVKWEDDVWFHIVEEEKKKEDGENEDEERSQAESQISDVIVYQIFGFEGETLPYSLTIIDTPGYGDIRGIKHDDIISERLLDWFRSGEVHEMNAVGLVLTASVNRLNDRLRYIFDSVVSLFGKDMEKNIVALITHSDGLTPENVLKALKTGKIKCARNEKNQPVYFLFNNRLDKDRTEDTEALQHADKITTRGMRQFTEFLEKTAPQNLMTTVEVLNSRIRLTACIQNLKERVEFTELKQRENQQTQEALKKHEEEMKRNEEFTVEVHMREKRSKTGCEETTSFLETLEKQMKELQKDKDHLLEKSFEHVVRLDQIALNVISLSTQVHLDFLIEKMKEKGDAEKVQKLEEMKSRVEKMMESWQLCGTCLLN
ncbi:uncharacterized protein LOC119914591 [Micropterus salmoides]|uniref:uncharacterized protein LOC119914591 n=1 Tax=Micropterus salmoides TaxID=27706 RepID=UPI0018ED3C1F|nr:uncharacterized protein LOC119914591 [Micropterus salmoides]